MSTMGRREFLATSAAALGTAAAAATTTLLPGRSEGAVAVPLVATSVAIAKRWIDRVRTTGKRSIFSAPSVDRPAGNVSVHDT